MLIVFAVTFWMNTIRELERARSTAVSVVDLKRTRTEESAVECSSGVRAPVLVVSLLPARPGSPHGAEEGSGCLGDNSVSYVREEDNVGVKFYESAGFIDPGKPRCAYVIPNIATEPVSVIRCPSQVEVETLVVQLDTEEFVALDLCQTCRVSYRRKRDEKLGVIGGVARW